MRFKLIFIFIVFIFALCLSCANVAPGVPASVVPKALGEIFSDLDDMPDLSNGIKAPALPAKTYEKEKINYTGNVIIKCVPGDTKVFLDGAYVGKAKKFSSEKTSMIVSVGAHVLIFEKKGYMNELREVLTNVQTATVIGLTLNPRPKMKPGEKKKKKKSEWWKVLGF